MSLSQPSHHLRVPSEVLPPLRSSSPASHWSSDSSDMESVSTAESSSPPRTPEMAMEVDPVPYVPNSKSEEPSIPQLTATPSKPKTHPVHVHSHHHHQRLSSALQLLKSFPVPHFHHHHNPSATSSTTSSSSSSIGSSNPSSFSLHFRGCKSNFAVPPPRTAAVAV